MLKQETGAEYEQICSDCFLGGSLNFFRRMDDKALEG